MLVFIVVEIIIFIVLSLLRDLLPWILGRRNRNAGEMIDRETANIQLRFADVEVLMTKSQHPR